MIDPIQLRQLSQKFGIDSSTVLREYVQILFLNELFTLPASQKIYFKGGTCLRLLFGSNRFSEDLDFTVPKNLKTEQLIQSTHSRLTSHLPNLNLKPLPSLEGVSYKLSFPIPDTRHLLAIRLDLSQREDVLLPSQSTITTSLPVSSFALINYLDPKEILAEKIRAIMTREKGRDVYDLWYLLNRQVPFDRDLIQTKLDYYHETFDPQKLMRKLSDLSDAKLASDLRPFLPIRDRAILPNLKSFTLDAISKSFS